MFAATFAAPAIVKCIPSALQSVAVFQPVGTEIILAAG